jgi:hypothetical protein
MKSLIIIALAIAPLTAHAQDINFGALADDTNIATVSAGADQGLVLGAGYGRVLAYGDRPLVVGVDFALQWAEVDIEDFRFRLGAIAPIVGRGNWKVVGAAASIVRGTNNETARMITFGQDVAVLAGRYSRHWFAVAELGFDWALATHIAHSDAYRMQVYADSRDGWYGNAGGTLRAGIQTGVSVRGNDVILRAGRLVDIGGNPPLFPFYATLGYDRRW